MDYKKNYEYWLTDDYFNEETKTELKSLAGNEKEIEERFYKNLDFGTGGLRGVLGAGTNRMNIYSVRRATQGLANYILKNGGANPAVVIAHDCRRMSPEFSREAALVMSGNGIRAYVFDSLRPTPLLSFAVRELGATAGIVITASHNPPEYNGYKVYWSDGGQVPYPRDEAIIEEVNQVENFSDIKTAEIEQAKKDGLYQIVSPELDDAYIGQVAGQCINRDIVKEMADELTIIYTPIHGTGNIPVRRALAEIGFRNVFVVPEQELPDANFSTVSYPNPEDPAVFKLAMKLAEEKGADIIIGTDPDADRVGAVVKNDQGKFVVLTGNMTGLLLTEYILSQKKAQGGLPANGAVISTIVSTDLTRVIAEHYGITYFDVLTGFKYIGEKIKEFEENESHSYLFGFEESYGCLAGTYARDKDAVVATTLLCEMAAYYKKQGMTLYDALQAVYQKYGYCKESIESITLKGLDGLEKMKATMTELRVNPPKTVNGRPVTEVRDYEAQTIVKNNEQTGTGLPVSNVLYYVTDDESWFCVRPSGTEPKIKIYFGVKGKTADEVVEKLQAVTKDVMERVLVCEA